MSVDTATVDEQDLEVQPEVAEFDDTEGVEDEDIGSAEATTEGIPADSSEGAKPEDAPPVADETDSRESSEEEEGEPPPTAIVPPQLRQPAPTAEVFSTELLTQAQLRGMPENVAKSFGTPVELQRYLAGLGPSVAGDTRPDAQPAAGPFQVNKEALAGLDPEIAQQFEAMANHVNAMHAHNASERAKLTNDLQPMRDNVQNVTAQMQLAEHNAKKQQFDGVLAGWDGWETVFGKGPGATLDPNGNEGACRSALWDKAKAIERACGVDLPTAMVHARQMVFPDQEKQAAQLQLQAKVTKRNGQSTARPSQRHGKGLSADERAGNYVSQQFRDRGFGEDSDDDDAVGYE